MEKTANARIGRYSPVHYIDRRDLDDCLPENISYSQSMLVSLKSKTENMFDLFQAILVVSVLWRKEGHSVDVGYGRRIFARDQDLIDAAAIHIYDLQLKIADRHSIAG